jgi:PIN domain nuclease of toxin-antitoxin system
MNLLLDSHAFLWFISGNAQLPVMIVNKIIDPSNKCYVSIASLWEIVIKYSLGKIEIRGGFKTIEDFLENNDIEVLTINVTHTKKLLSLKNIHKDPFDRIIISQALVEKLVIITKDDVFKDYKVKVIW